MNILGTEGDDPLIGTAADDFIEGLGGDDQLSGLQGADIILGGKGNDALWGDSGNDKLSGDEENDVLDGGTGNDELSGGIGDDTLYGADGEDELYGGLFDGNDVLDGGAGPDFMDGGEGDDVYFVESAGDIVSEDPNEGIDTVNASISYTLRDDVENLTLTGSGALDGEGNGLDNLIVGNAGGNTLTGLDGDDTLDGGGGIDDLIGGRGNDTYRLDHIGDVVTELANEGVDTVAATFDFVLAAEFENLTLLGSADIDATGNERGNVIKGNSGANVLTGGLGDDSYYRGAGDTIVELAGGGVDTVFSSIAYRLGIQVEHLALTGAANINGTGNAGANTITGNAGRNTLNGLGGADKMSGGRGDDIYLVGNNGDQVLENAGPGTGIDLVRSSIGYVLPANVEKLELTGNAANGSGNGLDNTIIGNGLKNRLDGGAGRDELVGGGGSDVLIGGRAADLFRFNAPGEGGPTGDAMTDFRAGEDRIALDHGGFGLSGAGTLASQGATFVVGNAATTSAPTVIFKPFTDEVWWDGDGTGAGAAQRLAVVSLSPFVNLAANDFVVV